jgi:hypothetical protein
MEAEKKRRTEAYDQSKRNEEFKREFGDKPWLAQNGKLWKTPISVGVVTPLLMKAKLIFLRIKFNYH